MGGVREKNKRGKRICDSGCTRARWQLGGVARIGMNGRAGRKGQGRKE